MRKAGSPESPERPKETALLCKKADTAWQLSFRLRTFISTDFPSLLTFPTLLTSDFPLIPPQKRKQNKRGSNHDNINGHQHPYVAITYAALQAIHSCFAKPYEYQDYWNNYREA